MPLCSEPASAIAITVHMLNRYLDYFSYLLDRVEINTFTELS